MSDRAPARVLYVTDLTFERYDPADLFDLAYLLFSPDHDLRGVCLTTDEGGERVLNALAVRAKRSIPIHCDAEGLRAALAAQSEPVNLVVVGGYATVADAMEQDRAFFRERVARLFLIGGHANDYGPERHERLPIDPRLRDRNPDRFAATGDTRITNGEQMAAFGRLLASGEGVIWLPRDISLWRYAAPGILSDGGPITEFLLRELFAAKLGDGGPPPDRYDAADAPVLLSSLPALLLATQPDPFAWMRLFRVVTAHVKTEVSGAVSAIETPTESPNLHVVIAIDGQALGKRMTERLRIRPLLS